MLISQLNEAVKVITDLVKKDEYSHMRKPWEMVIGGLIVPAMIEVDRTLVEHPRYKALQEKYTREKLEEFFNPKPQNIPVSGGVKFRRLKDKVNKKSRFERELGQYDRDKLILWWNKNQRLVPKDDPKQSGGSVCVALAEELNREQKDKAPIAPLQLGGYFSYLCRMALRTERTRMVRFENACKRGAISILPVYTPELLDAIRENYNEARREESQRAKDHAELARRRASGDKSPVIASEDLPLDQSEQMFPEPTPDCMPAPKASEEEEFDVRYM